MTEPNIYGFSIADLNGRPMPMGKFAGLPLVIVNTASRCGFTPQYAGLARLWRERRDDGLVVLGVPCNDFGAQEPGDNATIGAFCRESYGVDFPMTEKIHVRGPDAHPLFRWLAERGGYFARPRWNFYKYLIGRDGTLKDWFASPTEPGSGRFRRAVDRIAAR